MRNHFYKPWVPSDGEPVKDGAQQTLIRLIRSLFVTINITHKVESYFSFFFGMTA